MNEDRKKKKKGLIIGIIAGIIALAGLGVGAAFLFGGKGPNGPTDATGDTADVSSADPSESGTEPAADIDEDLINQLFWNVDGSVYNGKSEAGTSSRPTDKDDGYYHVQFAVNGRTVERRVGDKKLINQIDNLNLMGLVFDEKNIVVGIRRLEEFTGGFLYRGYYYSKTLEDGTIVINSAEGLDGMDVEIKLPEKAKIFDVSGAINPVGYVLKPTDLMELDRVYVVQDKQGNIIAAYVTSRYIKKKVYWNVERKWDSTLLKSTREPDENGIYTFLVACEGEQLELKTKSAQVAYDLDRQPSKCFSVLRDEEGYVTAYDNPNTGGIFGSWYHITELEGNKITAHKFISASDTGNTSEGVLAADYECYDVSGNGDFIGQKYDNLKVYDQIHAFKNPKGEIYLIFVVGRTVDNAEIYWNMKREADTATKTTKKVPDANGYYWFELACNGSVKRYKTNDKSLADKLDADASRTFALEVDGDTILKKMSTNAKTGGSVIASWYNVTERKSATEYSSKKGETGAVRDFELASNCKIYNVTDNNIYDDHAGELLTQMNKGDLIHCLTNIEGKVVYVMLIRRMMQGEIYWNLNRKYSSTTKSTTRTPDADGYYVFTMATGGKQVTLKTKDKSFADKIDYNYGYVMVMQVSGDIITRVGSTSSKIETSGGVVASWYDVITKNGNQLHTQKLIEASDKGRERDVEMAPDCQVYNVGAEYTIKGEKTDVRVGDRIHVLMNSDQKASYIFIVNRPGATKKAVCPECGKEVTWTSFNGSFADSDEVSVTETIDGTETNLHVLHYFMNGDRNLSSQASTLENTIIHFDMNGHTLTGGEAARTFAVFRANSTLKIFDLSSKKGGVIKSQLGKGIGEDTVGNEYGGVFWIRYATGKLIVKDVTLDFSAMDQKKTSGAIYIPSKAYAEFENVTIKGAKHALAGAALTSAGNLVLKNVTVTGGSNESAGSVNITGGTLTIAGNTSIKGGKLADGSAANLILPSTVKIQTTSDGITSPAGSICFALKSGGVFTADEFEAYKDAFYPDIPGEIVVTSTKALEIVYALEKIEAAEKTLTIERGGVQKIVVNPVPASASLGTLTYTVSDTSKVSVDSNGNAKGLQETGSEPVTVTISTEGGLTTTVAITVLPPAAGSHFHAVGTAAEIQAGGDEVLWQKAVTHTDLAKYITTETPEGGEVYICLDADITMTGVIELKGRSVFLCLNGHKLTTGTSTRAFNVNVGTSTPGKLVITDCSSGETGTIVKNDAAPGSSGPYQGGLLYVTGGSTVELYGGTLTGGVPVKGNPGGNISVRGDGSTVKIYGGTISAGHSVNTYGGNIEMQNASELIMYGGTIEGGISDSRGGNISLQTGASLTMYGGTIKDGNAATFGGNVAVFTGSSVTLYGGSIENGTAGSYGGNLTFGNGSTSNAGVLTVDGGEIKGGTAATYAGSIYVGKYSSIVLKSGTIEGGTATGGSSGTIYLGGTMTVDGGSVIGGSTTKNGGAINSDGGELTLNAGTISGGESGQNGGTIALGNNGILTVAGGGIYGGTLTGSGYGPNVAVTGAATFTMTDGTIGAEETLDPAKNSVYLAAAATASIEGGHLTKVTAETGIAPCITGGTFFEAPAAELLPSGYLMKDLDTPETETLGEVTYTFRYQVYSDEDVVHITLPDTLEATIGTDEELTAAVVPGRVDITKVEWTSSDETVATVAKDATDPYKAVVTPLAAGNADITLTINDEFSAKTTVSVTKPIPPHKNHCICGGIDTCLATASANGHVMNKPADNWTAVTTEAELRAAITAVAIDTDVYIYLGEDIEMSGSHISTASRKVHLCLNGHKLTAPNAARVFAIYKSSDTNNYPGTLTITDCSEDKTGKITALSSASGPTGQGGFIYCTQNGTLELYAGTLENGRTSGANPGGCVSVRGSGIFRMYGGTIKNGTAGSSGTPYGGNVEVQGGASFIMYDGEISGGSANRGGNLSVYSASASAVSSITIKGGTIKGGKESGTNSVAYGGNVVILGPSVFTMDGGTIEGGKSGSYGGNITLNSTTATFTMNGGEIKDGQSTTSGGNIYNAGTFTLNGGTIASGKATTHGGNIASEGTVNLKGGEIHSGDATTMGGNVSMTSTGKLNVENVTIYGGKAVTKGANVYLANKATLEMTGGTIVADEYDGAVGNALYVSETSVASVKGGYLSSVYADAGAAPFITDGKFIKTPDALTVADGYCTKDMASPETVTVNGKNYSFLVEIVLDEGSIAVTLPATLESSVGRTVEVTATVDAGTQTVTKAEWTSSDETVATVVKDTTDPYKAVVTPLAIGEVDITLTINDKASGTAHLTVVEHVDHCICGGVGECIETATPANGHTELKPTESWQKVTTTAEMKSAINGVSIGGDVFIYLGSDVTMTGLGEYYGRNIHLCLNGHTLKSASNNRVFYLAESTGTSPATPLLMTICDCSSDESGKIVPNSDTSAKAGQGGLIYLQKNATLELYGGSIEGGKTSGSNPGGNISIRNNSAFTMYGGRVADGYAGAAGGNIEMQMGGSMTMYGGTVEGGAAKTYAGNICVGIASSSNGKGTFTMKGGEIKDGKATTYAGNIYVSSYATMTMDGGEIRNGKAAGGSSGAIYLGGSLTMSDGIIEGGTATGNGGLINVDGSSAKFTMTGGILEGGKAGDGKTGNVINATASSTVSISGDAVIIATENDKYAVYTTSKNFTIGGEAKLIVDVETTRERKLIYIDAESAVLTISGGTFYGDLVPSQGKLNISRGYFLIWPEPTPDGTLDIGSSVLSGFTQTTTFKNAAGQEKSVTTVYKVE